LAQTSIWKKYLPSVTHVLIAMLLSPSFWPVLVSIWAMNARWRLMEKEQSVDQVQIVGTTIARKISGR
ncbi:hypothetical protein WDW86_11420, partial [Bdellovibrionota bacterium FG-2]